MSFSESNESGGKTGCAASKDDQSSVYLMVISEESAEATATADEGDDAEDVDHNLLPSKENEGRKERENKVPLSKQIFNNAASRNPSPCSELMVSIL